ncbi:MAG: ArsR family transcriptional regulator [Planctomycetes bacterium]|nr:ArsR family transcriptional regulator [Planctomycetota bacterium]
MPEYTEADRPRILDVLKLHGPRNVPALARTLGVNPTAVRQQLAVLQRDGLVAVGIERRRVGRPTQVWSLTAKAEALFPQAYGTMALSLLRQLREVDGEAKIERLFARRTRELMKAYRRALRGKSAAEKFRELARIRDREGYMARADRDGLTEHHCPIAAIAREFPAVCRYEKLLFEAALGAELTRTEHIASGGRSCVYRQSEPIIFM